MTIYAGLDVSDKSTHVCVVDAEGAVVLRDCVASDPEVLAKWLKKHCAGLTRVVLETGPLSTFLYHGQTHRKRVGYNAGEPRVMLQVRGPGRSPQSIRLSLANPGNSPYGPRFPA